MSMKQRGKKKTFFRYCFVIEFTVVIRMERRQLFDYGALFMLVAVGGLARMEHARETTI